MGQLILPYCTLYISEHYTSLCTCQNHVRKGSFILSAHTQRQSINEAEVRTFFCHVPLPWDPAFSIWRKCPLDKAVTAIVPSPPLPSHFPRHKRSSQTEAVERRKRKMNSTTFLLGEKKSWKVFFSVKYSILTPTWSHFQFAPRIYCKKSSSFLSSPLTGEGPLLSPFFHPGAISIYFWQKRGEFAGAQKRGQKEMSTFGEGDKEEEEEERESGITSPYLAHFLSNEEREKNETKLLILLKHRLWKVSLTLLYQFGKRIIECMIKWLWSVNMLDSCVSLATLQKLRYFFVWDKRASKQQVPTLCSRKWVFMGAFVVWSVCI